MPVNRMDAYGVTQSEGEERYESSHQAFDSQYSTGRPRRRSTFQFWLASVLVLGLCSALVEAQETIVLVGSGSSVPAPLYSRWAQEYGKRNPHIQMRYVPLGTSEGIKQISHGSGD